MRYVVILLFLANGVFAQDIRLNQTEYDRAFVELKGMLSDSIPLSFKRAVFVTENAYEAGQLNYDRFDSKIKLYADFCRKIADQGSLQYNGQDKDRIKLYAAVFRFMKDTTQFMIDKLNYFETIPFTYDFDDFLGERDWRKMFVSKLLQTQTGNCHSMPFLYKILCDELEIPSWLSMAPNHTYIKLWSRKTGWYNTELTSGYFPLDAWIMASGYIPLSAVQNRIYMDTLDLKQSVSVSLVDLAKGYERKFGLNADLNFIEKCCNLALNYYPLYINAMLLKAETLKKKFEGEMNRLGTENPTSLFVYPTKKKMFEDMQDLYARVHYLGYRKMPKEMYLNWLSEVSKEKNRYVNKDIQKLNSAK